MPARGPTSPDVPSSVQYAHTAVGLHEAMLYHVLPNGNVKCELCSHGCTIVPGKRGICGVRENRGGSLYSLVYGKACAWAIDPIEKKPFYHFFPGSESFSFSTVGCNFRCKNCQNWEISQAREIFGEDLPPETIVKKTIDEGSQGIAYTYTEPTIFFEYAYDTAKLARERELYNVFVTNGYMTEKTIDRMENIDASRIDLKFFDDNHYRENCGASLEPVLNSIKLLHSKQHIEVINLMIPTLNDSDDQIRAMATWVKDLDPDVPMHFIAYYPAYKMSIPQTPLETLERARKIAMDIGLRYVYTGNIPGGEGENTYCPNCKTKVIERYGFAVVNNLLIRDGNYAKCPECGEKIRVVLRLPWMK